MNSFSADGTRVLIGHSLAIQKVRRQIAKAAGSRSPVLLLGESGTGKEVVARLIHENGPKGPFVPIDCGALVGTLMESELFGHIKGSFTGAGESRRGLIAAADGGTAFLDEIGDLPLELQVKLLRLLQEREYRPVGSVQWHKVSVRRDLRHTSRPGAGSRRETLSPGSSITGSTWSAFTCRRCASARKTSLC